MPKRKRKTESTPPVYKKTMELIDKIDQLESSGVTEVRDIADRLGVKIDQIYRAKKKRQFLVTKQMFNEHIAKRMVTNKIDAIEQLNRINQIAIDTHGWLEETVKGITEELEILPTRYDPERDKKDDTKRQLAADDNFYRTYLNLYQNQLLKFERELRAQYETWLNIAKTLYTIDDINWFRDTVLEVINEVNPETKAEIIRRLNERRAIRGTLTGNQ